MAGDGALGIPGYEDPVEIGRGGFGVVYRAHQPALARVVAIKVLAGAHVDDRTRDRFDRERRVMGSLSSHPAIVTVHESGLTPAGMPYLIMELLAGGSLADRIARDGALGWPEATAVCVRLAEAVEAAHRAGVLHRDIKPENVLLSEYGEVKLTDFGIAAMVEGTATTTTSVTASVAHAAPEVLEGKGASTRSDVYALGSTLYALLAGSPAFRRDTDDGVLPVITRVLSEPPPDLRPRGVPDDVCRVIEQAMAKAPADRQPSAQAFRDELAAAAEAAGASPPTSAVPILVPVAAGAALAGAAREAAAPVVPAADVTTGRRHPRQRRVLVGAAIAAVVVLLAGAVAVAAGGGEGGDDDTATATSGSTTVRGGDGRVAGATTSSATAAATTTAALGGDKPTTTTATTAPPTTEVAPTTAGTAAGPVGGAAGGAGGGRTTTTAPRATTAPPTAPPTEAPTTAPPTEPPTTAAPTVTVPDVRGQTLEAATATLNGAGIRESIPYRYDCYGSTNRGRVVNQAPGPGTVQSPSAPVSLQLEGNDCRIVPAVVGQNLQQATASFQAAGLGQDIPYDYNCYGSSSIGAVVSQSPAPGADVPQGTAMVIHLQANDC